MKTLYFVFSIALFTQFSYSQNKFEDLFKYPLERDVESIVRPYPAPYNTDHNFSTVFFNINISQQSAPQNEPSVCISRKNPNRVVAAWRDFRYGVDPNPNRRVGYSYSTNGGLTWSVSALLDSTLIPGFTRNSDPVVTVDTAGNFYIAVITITFPSGDLALATYRSTDGGVTFPFAMIGAQGGSEDKEWITTDLTPSSPFVNTLYISWTRFVPTTNIKVIKSTNNGANWTAPVNVSDVSDVQGSNICISRNGQVNVTWMGFGGTEAQIMFDHSTDGGVTFGTDVLVANGAFPDGLPNGAFSFPFIASDNTTGPRSGWIYIVFADNRNLDCDVFFTRSTNNGANWSAPHRVNDDVISNGKIQYWPDIAVNDSGKIVIMYMDSRNTSDNTIVEAFIARSADGGATFVNELVSNEPTPTATPGSNVRFGDYMDIDYLGSNAVPVWTDERQGGFNMDIFSAEISDFLPVVPGNTAVADQYFLGQNYPNPFNPSTVIQFGIPKSGNTLLKVYDIMGRYIKTLVNGNLNAGMHSVRFEPGNLSSGIYFYTIYSGSFTETKKMLYVK